MIVSRAFINRLLIKLASLVNSNKCVVTSLFLVGCVPLTFLFSQKFAFLHYNSASDAPFKEVTTILQDTEGFLWVGSKQGLYRFDGNEFENFGIHLKSQHIHRLIAHKGKILFVNDTGLHQMEELGTQPQLSEIIEGDINQVDSLPFYPNDFLISPKGSIWLSQSNHSLGRYTNGTFKTYHFSTSAKPQHITLRQEPNGLLWALSPLDGLFQYDRLNDVFEKIMEAKGTTTFLINGDYLLLGGESLKIYYIRNKSKPQLLRTIALSDDLVTAIQVDVGNRYIVGTKKGQLYLLPQLKERLQPIYGSNTPHRIQELDFGVIHQIYPMQDSISPNGMLAIASSNGLWILKNRFFETVLKLPKNNPNSIAIGRQQETWVAMNGLYDIRPKKGQFQAQKMGGNFQVEAVAFAPPSTLWLSVSTPSNQIWKVVNNQYQKKYNFDNRGEGIFYLYADSQENLWFCQAPQEAPIIGIAKIDKQGNVQYYDNQKGFSNRILVLKESKRGEIYAAGIGEDTYLYQYDSDTDAFVNLSQPLPFPSAQNFEVHDLAIDDIGVVWLATTDGLLMYDTERTTWIQDENLGHEEIRGVTALPNGGIWIATATNGLVYYDNNHSIPIGEASGLPAIINSYRCLATDKNGRIWAGTAEGLVYSLPSNATLKPSTQPRLKKVRRNHQEAINLAKNTLRISDKDHLELQYTSLDYHVEHSDYQYQLMDRAEKKLSLNHPRWKSNGVKNKLILEDLVAGKYSLEVRSKQSGGYQWSTPLSIELDVITPWYRQAWFLYPLGIIVIGIISYYLRLFILRRVKKLQQLLHFQNEKLEEKQALLDQKILEFDEHQQEYNTTMSNIQMLELFIKAIPPRAGWNEIITAMGKAVDQSIDIAAFEIAFIEKKELVHRGYSTKEKGNYTFRSKLFDPKTSLTSWAIANQQEVVINDFDQEHHLYIDKKEAYHFQSLVIIPFLKNKQSVALCAYSVGKQQFNDNEVIMLRILVRFILQASI